MKKILIGLLALIPFLKSSAQSTGNDTTQYIYYKFTYGNALDRYWAKKVLLIPNDTTFSKDGIALKGGTFYVGNGIKWVTGGGGGGTDSALAALYGLKIFISGTTKYIVADTNAMATRFNRDKLKDSVFGVLNAAINLKKDKSDSAASTGYLPVHRLADTAAVLRSILSSGYDSASSQGGGFHTQPYNDIRYKIASDSAGVAGYASFGRLYKLRDSIIAVLNASIALKKDKFDSLSNTSSYVTLGRLYKTLDSLNALVEITNYRSVGATGIDIFNFSTSGNQTNITFPKVRDTTATYFGWAADSALILPFSAKMTNYGSAPGFVEFNYASIPAATGYPTGTQLIVPDSGQHYVDTGSGGTRGWKRIIGGGVGGSSGITSVFKKSDSLFYSLSGINYYISRDSVQWAMAKDTVVRATTNSARNDANSVVMLPDGSLICAYTGFGTQVGDVDSAAILWKRSYDHGRTWTVPDTAVKLGGSGSYIPSLYVKANGTVLMLYLYQPNVNIGYINSVTLAPPYTPGTWSAPSTLYNPSQYQSPASDRILKTQAGSLLYATCYPTTTDHSSAGGNYYVKILKSTDDGATWAAKAYQIASSDSLAVEPGLFQVDDGSIYCYFRNRSGFVGMALSTDTANSFTASFPTNLYAPNSTSTIKYYQKYRRLFALHNKHDQWTSDAINGTSGRFAMQISTSPNNGIDWYRQTYIDSTTGFYSFEPSIFFDTVTNEVLCTYSKFNNAGSLCDLQNVRVPIYHLVGTADVHELNDLILTPSYSRSYPQRAGGIPYGHQGLRFLTMTQKEIGFTQGTTNPAGDYMAFSQANSNVGIFAGLLLNKTHSLNSGMTFETTTKAESGSPTFQFSSIDSGASNVSGAFPGTTKIFGVLNNYQNTGLGFFVYGNGQIDVGGNNTSSFLRVYNNVLGPTNAFFTVGSVTGGNTAFAPWIHMKGNNSAFGMTWDCNTSTNAPNSSFWIDGNNNGAAIANASSLFRVDNNGAANPAASTKIRLQLLGDGRLAQNTLAPTAMFTIQGSTTQSQIGATGWRSSFLPGTYVDNVTGNGNVIRFVASDYHGADSFATSNTVTYSNLANGYFKGNQKVGGSLTVTHKWAVMADSGDVYINGNLNLTTPQSGTTNDWVLLWSSSDSTVRKIAASSLNIYNTFIQTADGTVTNSAGNLSILGTGRGSNTVLANTLAVGSRITLKGFGNISTAGSAPTLTMSFANSTSNASVGLSSLLTASMSTVAMEWEMNAVVRSTGSSGSIQINGWFSISGIKVYVSGLLTLNTTVSQTFDSFANFGTASTSNTIVSNQNYITIMP